MMIVGVLLGLLASQTPAAPIPFNRGLTLIVMTGPNQTRHAVSLILNETALSITDTGPGRLLAYWERPVKREAPFSIGYEAMTSVIYDRRSAASVIAAGPQVRHYLTIQFTRPDGMRDVVEIEMATDVAPNLVALLQARSGRHIERVSG
jgi:hypothetical protein